LIKRAGNDVLEVGPQPQVVGNDSTTLPIGSSHDTRDGVNQPLQRRRRRRV
jgi:hypothetical protein